MSNGKQFAKMFSAHLKITFREKQAWFWGIFFPVILMVIFMLIFGGGGGDDFKAKVAIVDDNPNPASQGMLEQLKQLPVFEIETGEPVSREQADEWILDKEVSAVIVLPESADAKTLQLIVNKEDEKGATSQAVSGILNNFIQQANLIAIGATPTYELTMEAVSSGSEDLEYEDFLMTGMIALSVAQGGLFGMVDLVEMRRKGLMKRLRMTPAKMGLYGLSDMVMRLIFGVIQVVILSLIGVLGFGVTLHINILSLVVAFLVGALTFSAMGYLFSSFSKSLESYMGLANIASFLMMFLSGIFFPLESMPDWLVPVSKVLPLTYFVAGIRDGLVYATGLATGTFWMAIGILALWGIVCYGIGSRLYKVRSIAAER